MEPGYSLTILVCAVGALHLAWRAGAYMSKYIASSKGLQAGAAKSVKRDDWYMFFHRSDLTGELSEKVSGQPTERQSVRSQKRQGSRPTVGLR